MANTLAYYDAAKITAVVQASGGSMGTEYVLKLECFEKSQKCHELNKSKNKRTFGIPGIFEIS